MCKSRCMKPDNLKESPEKCSTEQIKECHGTEVKHHCTGDASETEEDEKD